MRRILAIFSFLLTLVILLAGAGAFYALALYGGPGPAAQDTRFVVESGQGVGAIAGRLESEGLIGNALVFRAAARVTGADRRIHAGEYMIAQGASMQDILRQMEEGDIILRQYTVREGLTSWQVVQLLQDVEGLSGEIDVIPDEGTLLPETYSFMLGDSRAAQIEAMQAAMTATIDELWPERAENLPVLTKAQAIILASIVEKETAVASERARVAGVFINRLKRGMPLQTDPTVIYALTMGKIEDKGQGPIGRRLLRRDLQVDSPYNTYKNPGLPPGPIANPGRAAIAAVLNPEEHDYYYFVADGTGGHVFARTLDEHNANVAKWRKIRAAQ